MAKRPALPVDYDAIRKALVAAVRLATGLGQGGVIMAEPEQPGAARPCLPFFTAKMINPGMRYGEDAAIQLGPTSWEYAGPRGVVVSFQAFGTTHEEAYGLMALLQAALATPPVLEVLRQAGVAVWSTANIADVSALMNTGYEGRAQMDVTLGVASSLAVDVGFIDQATIVGTADVGQELVTATVTIHGS